MVIFYDDYVVPYCVFTGYVSVSFLAEISLLLYLKSKIRNPRLFKVNLFHIIRLFSGEIARADVFTDALFVAHLYTNEVKPILFPSAVVLLISLAYPFFMYFRLMRVNKKEDYLPHVERNAKLAYVSDFQSIATTLDSFCLSNFHGIKGISIAIPKLWAILKTSLEDLP